MTNKSSSPFEIRTRMLEIAQDYLKAQYETNLSLAQATFQELQAAGKTTQEEWTKYVPQMYDFNDIIKKAQELYGFVSKRD